MQVALSLCLLSLVSVISASPLSKSRLFIDAPAMSRRWQQPDLAPLSLVGIYVETDGEAKTLFSPLDSWSATYNATFGDIEGWIPVTVIQVNDSVVSCQTLTSAVELFKSTDDVFDEVFLDGIIISSQTPVTASTALASCFPSASFVVTAGGGGYGAYLSGDATPPAGPYLAQVSSTGIRLTQIWRSYRDEQQAFTEATVPLKDGNTFASGLTLPVAGMNTRTIGVPSRLYYVKTTDKPLNGNRIGVKDIFDVRGTRRGCGNRAYWNFYAPRSDSAVAVQRLIDLGAIIVGKTIASQFANGETPTADWVDQLCPFNPRGDGYNDPSSSSSGSGAAMGAYSFLDFAIGSDTGGSILSSFSAFWLSGAQGIFGLRPSVGAVSLTGVMPLSSQMDTAGGFARDAAGFSLLHKSLYGSHFKSYPSLPKKLIVASDEFPLGENNTDPLFSKFINQITTFLGASVSNTTVSELWNSTDYGAQYGPLETYLNLTYPTLIAYDQYTNFTGPWIREYQAVNQGRLPFIDPVPLARYAFGLAQGAAGYANATIERETFQQFVSDHLFPANNESCTETLYLYAQSDGSASPRNVYLSPPSAPIGYGSGRIANFAQTPEAVIPFAEVDTPSSITNGTQSLPLTLSIIARRNCDYVLLDLATALADAGIIGAVKTGPTLF